ncbi:MAG TPA: YraN family protein [Actinomycetota bacterium]
MATRASVGRSGEGAAERLYVARGYRVLARNWRCRLGELDLVLLRDGTLVICEVKARRGSRFGGPHEAVDARKRRKLRTLAQLYLRQLPSEPDHVRFDVASVRIGPRGSASVRLFQDAF